MASLRNRSLLFRILQQARPCWLRLTGIAVLGLLSIPLALLFPLPLKIAVDSVLGHQPLPAFMSMSWVSPSSAGALVLAVGLLLAIGLLTSLQSLASWWLQTYTGEKLVWDFRARLLNHVQRLPLVFHDHYGATDSVYRIQNAHVRCAGIFRKTDERGLSDEGADLSKLGPEELAEYLGVSLAQLAALIVEPRPSMPELLAGMAVRYGVAAHTLRLVAETPLPPPETAD